MYSIEHISKYETIKERKVKIMVDTIVTWQITEAPAFHYVSMKVDPGRLELAELPSPELMVGQVLVEVAGCAICFNGGENLDETNTSLLQSPQALNYEISGTVVGGEEKWLGKEVLIPASWPCGHCELCRSGQISSCDNPQIPLDSAQFFSSFSSHVPVSSVDLFEIRHRVGIPLEHIAGVISELTMPCQAIRSASISQGDLVMVVSNDRVGQYLQQIAKTFGARTIIAVNIGGSSYSNTGNVADVIIDVATNDPESVNAQINAYCAQENLPQSGWKIFNTAGGGFDVQTVDKLLEYADIFIDLCSSKIQLQHFMKEGEKQEVQICETQGFSPELYSQILQMVTSGKVQISQVVLTRPMSWIKEAFEELNNLGKDKRVILTTDDFGLEFNPEPKSCR